MDPIPDINIRDFNVQRMHGYLTTPSSAVPNAPAVTLYIGVPIIDLPGCVEYHPGNKKSETLKQEDPNKTITLCPDGSVPSYQPIDYVPEDLVFTKEAPIPDFNAGKAPKAPSPKTDIPETPQPDTEVPCPGPNAPRIGDVAQNQKEKVSGFELNEDKTICITLYETIGPVEQYLPSAQVVATTATIATVATTSALLAKPLADLLLKVVKPVVKKAIETIQTKLGRPPRRLTAFEIQANRYREKRGLLPLKDLKRKRE
jgi:hypothetical protein